MNGYYITIGKRAIFYRSNAQRKSAKLTDAIIDAIGQARNLDPDFITRCKADKATREQVQHDYTPATLEEKTTANGYTYYCIKGKYFSECLPLEDFKKDIIVF